jgi:hypothetical protein
MLKLAKLSLYSNPRSSVLLMKCSEFFTHELMFPDRGERIFNRFLELLAAGVSQFYLPWAVSVCAVVLCCIV